MKSYLDVLMVNPPVLRERPDQFGEVGTLFVPGDLKVEAMNPGILSIVSYLNKKGFSFKIVDLLLSDNFDELRKAIRDYNPAIVGVSSSSAFDYIDSLLCLEIAKEESPLSITVLGGQHAGPLGEYVFDDTSFLDVLCLYEGEKFMEELITRVRRKNSFVGLPGSISKIKDKLFCNPEYPELIPLEAIAPLDYTSYPNYQYYTPFIEESRGCPFGCAFCTSERMNKRRIRIKDPRSFQVELDRLCDLFGKEKIIAVLAATFGLRSDLGNETVRALAKSGIKWTTEIRVDCPWENYIELATDGGLTVLNVGVESFSKDILRLMCKTIKPEAYLEKTAKLLNWFKNTNKETVLRTNMMLYIGETPRTIRESLAFLNKYGDGIKSMLCSSVFVVYGTHLYKRFPEFQKKYGCELVREPYWDKSRVFPCKLSRSFSFEETSNLAKVIEKMYSTEEGWYMSESYHYSQSNDETVAQRRESLIRGRFLSETR